MKILFEYIHERVLLVHHLSSWTFFRSNPLNVIHVFFLAIWKSRHGKLGIVIFFLLFEALIFAFRSFLWSKAPMVKFFSNTLASFPGSVCCCLEHLFCRDVVGACFWRKELRHGRYLSFKNLKGWKLQLVCICISDKEPY